MFLAWRTQLREAMAASELGRLDEAAQRISQHKLKQYKPGEELARHLATAYLARAARRADEANFAGAWHDLAQAKELDGASEPWLDAQARLSKLAVNGLEPLLASGDFELAKKKLTQFERQLPADVLRSSQDAIRRLESAANLSNRGKFTEAEAALLPAIALRPEWNTLAIKLEGIRRQATDVQHQTEALHAAMLAEDWNQTLALADKLLAVTPDLRVAREARQKAWAAVGTKMTDSRPTLETQHWPSADSLPARPAKEDPGVRFMLWIDAVGGFLVCLADEVWIGQAAEGNPVAIPIQAELSRKHAKITRSGDGYVLEPAHAVMFKGKPLFGKRLLADGDEFELGRVKLRFRQPHSLSATARLEIVSRHRTEPNCDGILLMAESCVLGPKWQDHVVCRDWQNDIVLCRQGNHLFCRASEPVEIDGVSYDSRGALQPNSRVSGEDYSFSLEIV